jgi:hypothetical protein
LDCPLLHRYFGVFEQYIKISRQPKLASLWNFTWWYLNIIQRDPQNLRFIGWVLQELLIFFVLGSPTFTYVKISCQPKLVSLWNFTQRYLNIIQRNLQNLILIGWVFQELLIFLFLDRPLLHRYFGVFEQYIKISRQPKLASLCNFTWWYLNIIQRNPQNLILIGWVFQELLIILFLDRPL